MPPFASSPFPVEWRRSSSAQSAGGGARDQAARLLLDPAERGHVLVRAEQDPRLACAGLRGEIRLPLGQPVAVLGDPARHVRGTAVAHRIAQHRQSETVDLEEHDARHVRRRAGALAPGDPAGHAEVVGIVVIRAEEGLDHDARGRHHQGGEQRIAERADLDVVRQHIAGELKQQGVCGEDEQKPSQQHERESQRRERRRHHGVQKGDRRGNHKRRAGLFESEARHDRGGHGHRRGSRCPRQEKPARPESQFRGLPAHRTHGAMKLARSRSGYIIRSG